MTNVVESASKMFGSRLVILLSHLLVLHTVSMLLVDGMQMMEISLYRQLMALMKLPDAVNNYVLG